MISQINALNEHENPVIKHAKGETKVSEKKGKSMFPDVVLYEDVSSSVIIKEGVFNYGTPSFLVFLSTSHDDNVETRLLNNLAI